MAKSVFKFNKPIDSVVKDTLKTEQTLYFMANEAKRLMNDFVPFRDGGLSTNVEVSVKADKGEITYTQPYAQRMYYGSGYTFSTHKHPLATSHWDKAMLETKKDELVKSVENFVKR